MAKHDGEEFIAFDWCGWCDRYGRFTHVPSGKTLLCRGGMGQADWDRAQLEFFEKFPGLTVYKCLEGPYRPGGESLGTTEEICGRLRGRLAGR